jgi:hypothetical protein
MILQAQSNNSSRAYSRKQTHNPDEVTDEFNQRRSEPGPDDVYDEYDNRRGGDSYGPHYYDSPSSGDGCGAHFLG